MQNPQRNRLDYAELSKNLSVNSVRLLPCGLWLNSLFAVDSYLKPAKKWFDIDDKRYNIFHSES